MKHASTSTRRRKWPDPPPVIHVYDRRKIMARAWTLARKAREEQARKAFDLDVRIVGTRIIHNRPLSAHIAAIKLDLGAAQKLAWAEAKGVSAQVASKPNGGLVASRHRGALAPLRRIRFARIFRMMATAAHWIGRRFIPSRAA